MSFVSEVLVISGVAPGSGKGGSTFSLAQCRVRASPKRVGFLLLAFGLSLHLTGLVSKSMEGILMIATIAVGVNVLGLATAVSWVKVGSRKAREEAQEAAQSETEEVPEQ